ncbi:RNA polymerase II transcription elongation factor-domain-containing protein [Chytridium lagenaria]|nr:RNA polymerase II transcription elongation factor-domain-containing protein [Chytridium lagenaria]
MDPFLPTQEGPVTVSLALLDPSTADQHPKYAAITHKFKPDSIDYTKPGSLVNANETWTLEFASQEEGAQKFTVEEVPGKDIECLLFYDASTNTYTLEPLDSTIRTRPVRNDKPKRPDSKSTPLTLPPDSGATSPVDADFEDIFSDDDAAVAAEIMDEDFDDAFNEGDGGDDDEFERSLEEEIEAVQLDDDGFVEEEGEGRHIVGEEMVREGILLWRRKGGKAYCCGGAG